VTTAVVVELVVVIVKKEISDSQKVELWDDSERQNRLVGRGLNMITAIDETRCTGCGICFDSCPLDVLKLMLNERRK
jgi:ferredoxin